MNAQAHCLPPRKSMIALSTLVLLVARVQFHVPISAALVFEQPPAELTLERHRFPMSLKSKNEKRRHCAVVVCWQNDRIGIVIKKEKRRKIKKTRGKFRSDRTINGSFRRIRVLLSTFFTRTMGSVFYSCGVHTFLF